MTTELRYFWKPPKQILSNTQLIININNEISNILKSLDTKVNKQYNRLLSLKNFTVTDKDTIYTSKNLIQDIQIDLTGVHEWIDSLPDIVQSDWNTTDTTDMSYIWNKPDVPILESGLIPERYLPSYVDDVLEYATLASFPVVGERGKIYVDLSTDLTYRWSGSTYVEMSRAIITGVKGNAEQSYRTGNVNITAANIGLGNVANIDLSKAIKGITRNGTTFTYTCLDGTTGTFDQQDNNTTYSAGTGLQLTNTAFSVKLGYTTSGNNRAVQADANGNLYVVQKDDNTWRPIGTGATDAAAGNHTHTISLATDSGTNEVTLASNTKYKLTAGGKSIIFTTPVDNNTTYTFTNKGATLAWGTTSTIATVGGVDIKVTMPANPNTNTWRPVQCNGTSIGDYTLNLKAGTNVSLSNTNGAITITSTDTNTWRGILDNLTSSTNTTESLSAKQGYLLANGSARDNTKLPLAGGTLTGKLTIQPSNTSAYLDGLVLHDLGGGGSEGCRIRFTSASYTTGIALGPNSDKTNLLINDTYALIHSGNISSLSVSYATTSTESKLLLYCYMCAASKAAGYRKIASWTKTSSDNLDTTLVLLATNHYNGKATAVLNISFRKNSGDSTYSSGQTYGHWVFRSGTTMPNVVYTVKVSGTTYTLNLYIYETTWEPWRFTKLDEGGWTSKENSWTLYSGYNVDAVSIPSDETQIAITDMSSAAKLFGGTLTDKSSGWSYIFQNLYNDSTKSVIYLCNGGTYGAHLRGYTTSSSIYLLLIYNNSSEAFSVWGDKSAKFGGAVSMASTLSVTSGISCDSYISCTNLNAIDDVTISKGSGAARLRISNAGVLNANNVIEFSQDNAGNTKHFLIQDRMNSDNSRRYLSIWGQSFGSLISASCASSNSYCCVGIGAKLDLYWDTTAVLRVYGNAKATAWNTTSDIRMKDIIEDKLLSIEDIANSPLFTYKWKSSDFDNVIHVGTSALYWNDILPEVVTGDDSEENYLSLQYGTLGTVFGITIARKLLEQNKEISLLKEEIESLRKQILNKTYEEDSQD